MPHAPPLPRLLAISTAVPPIEIGQQEMRRLAPRLFDNFEGDLERLLPVFDNAGIARRYSCMPLDWYEKSHGWVERNGLYIDHALDLIEDASRRALADSGLTNHDIDGVVAVSATGIATPSLAAMLLDRLDLRRDVWRLPVFGLGCAGGVLGLARAAAMAQASPEQNVLFVVVELCALTFRKKDQSKSNVVATALFGDGAAAAVLSCDGDGPALTAWGEHCWPDSRDVMGWRIEDDGFGVLFSRHIPTIVRNDLGAATDDFLDKIGLSRRDIDGVICHPGGAKVIDAMEEVFDLPDGAMEDTRDVLRDYGNMSAATLMFILHRKLKTIPPGRYLMSALGPGFTVGFLFMETT